MYISNEIDSYINKHNLCSGCGLCQALFGDDKICIELKENGFYRPRFYEKLDEREAEKFKSLCPCLNMTESKQDCALFGKMLEAKVSWAADNEVRFKASSGGAVTAFLCYLLKEKKIDGVIHIAKAKADISCKTVISRTEAEIKETIGSLYMPSSLLKDIDKLLDPSETYALVGKGCDISAMKRYINEGHSAIRIAIYIGIMCGGSPSINGTYSILNMANISPDEITELRYRGYGWPGNFIVKSKSSEYRLSYNDAWAKYLGPTSSLACKICFNGIADQADITFGDAWYCNSDNYPIFDEQEGRNLTLLRTEKGRSLFYDSCKKGYLVTADEHIDIDIIEKMQPSQANRRYLAFAKILGLRIILFKYPKVNIAQLHTIAKNKRVSLIQICRTALGTIKRVKKLTE